ncbi:SET domain-containing protein [Neocallimastix californiae]|uniref:SET domain-containing protein n=1 Tax=Neocallimastix californiae TaxID=1754190 RepID=A0A1Y1Z7T2_9FUNG|nr:SET domain-containing protein [Neocallimastix californiae]|eukprot:ORY06266.1 SET domain-containing protein [Neocallimastix californiae]
MIESVPTQQPSKFKVLNQNVCLDGEAKSRYDSIPCDCKEDENCGSNCINRSLFIECNPQFCKCGEKCTNQRFQRYNKQSQQLKVFWSGGKGYGLKTEKPIKKDELIIEYTGEIMSLKACNERLKTIYKDMNSFYFIHYESGKVIDACQKGSVARFANHSCDPNCSMERWVVNGEIRVGLFALRNIEASEELLYDYNFHSFGEQQKCNCGSTNCRGVIGTKSKREEEEEEEEEESLLIKKERLKRLKARMKNSKHLSKHNVYN